jgi:hypothetical protein
MEDMLIGTVGAILAGLTMPAWGVIFAYMVKLFFNPVACPPPLKPGFATCEAYFDSEANAMRSLSFYLFYGYIGLCVTVVVGNMTLFYGFSSASEKLNKKVRVFGQCRESSSETMSLAADLCTRFEMVPSPA